jgi:hypothetical protein
VSSSSQNPDRVSTSRAFVDLAAAIDRRVSSDRAAELLANFRNAVRAEAAAERDALQARLNAVLDICDREQRNAMRWENPISVPEWVAPVQRAALGDDKRAEAAR